MDVFKSPYAEIVNRKYNTWCRYTKRLDTYGRGCHHGCHYCYAKGLLAFRNNWNQDEPAVADMETIRKAVSKLSSGDVVKLGGMTDCFQPIEGKYHRTLETIKELNDNGIHYLIVTKSATCVFPEYLDVYDRNLAHFQISITSTDDRLGNVYETASPQSERVRAIETLYRLGYDVSIRLSPFIPEYIDVGLINGIECGNILIEFLKVNHFVMRSFDIDYSGYTLKYGGYTHLELDRKIELANKLTDFDQRSVGEYVLDHYLYFRDNYNSNPYDCCNLRGIEYRTYPETQQEVKQ